MSRRLGTWLIILLVAYACAVVGTAAVARGGDSAVRIDDFEDRDLIAATGSAWFPLGDDLIGGKTILHLEAEKGGAHGSRGALRLAGTLGDGPNSFGGVWTAVAPGSRAADLSPFSGIRLRLRGEGDVLVGVRRGPLATSINWMARVKASPDWKDVTIPFADLRPQGKGREQDEWSPREARWFGVSSVPGASGPFRIEIDDVAWIGSEGSGKAPAPEPGAPPLSRALVPNDAAPLAALQWRELVRDTKGDGRPGLPDARALYVARDTTRPILWFRFDLEDALPPDWIGVNLALDSDGDPGNGTAWWGKNSAFRFDRLVSAWVWQVGNRYEGTVGIATSGDADAGLMTNDREVHLAVDRAARRVYAGVPASEIDAASTRIVAAVGSAMFFSDDLPDAGSVIIGPDPD